MNNQQRINNFLTYFAKIGEQNQNYHFDSPQAINQIYHELIFKDTEKEKGIDLSEYPNNYFNDWINYYKDNNKIEVFNPPYWLYFCQFISKDKQAACSDEHIKIYVPLDSKHIKEGAKMIFDFLTENNISHTSKIGKRIRFDDIVIRLCNENSAKKLLQFIKNNSYIQEGLIKPNPFAFQKNNIAMACDGRKSYNHTIAAIIAMYLESCKKNHRLQNVSYQDFFHFIGENYKSDFLRKETNNFKKVLTYEDEKEKLNYQYIIALILQCQNPYFTLDDYFKHYKESRTSKANKEDPKELLNELVEEMKEKFGEKQGINNIKAYLETGNVNYITNNRNLRERAINSSLREEITKNYFDKKISFKDYERELVQKEEKYKDDNEFESLFLTAIDVLKKKYGEKQGILQMKAYLKTGNINYITREYDLRNIVKNSDMREKVNLVLNLSDQTLEEYIEEAREKYSNSNKKR